MLSLVRRSRGGAEQEEEQRSRGGTEEEEEKNEERGKGGGGGEVWLIMHAAGTVYAYFFHGLDCLFHFTQLFEWEHGHLSLFQTHC